MYIVITQTQHEESSNLAPLGQIPECRLFVCFLLIVDTLEKVTATAAILL